MVYQLAVNLTFNSMCRPKNSWAREALSVPWWIYNKYAMLMKVVFHSKGLLHESHIVLDSLCVAYPQVLDVLFPGWYLPASFQLMLDWVLWGNLWVWHLLPLHQVHRKAMYDPEWNYPFNGNFEKRLILLHEYTHLPVPSVSKHSKCQVHKWADKRTRHSR